MPSRPTLKRTRGDTWTISMVVSDADPDTGVAAPYAGLAADTVVSTIRNRMTDAILWTGTKAAGNIVVSGSVTGKLTITVPAATTRTATSAVYVIDVEVTVAGSGRVFTPLVAEIQVEGDVTWPA